MPALAALALALLVQAGSPATDPPLRDATPPVPRLESIADAGVDPSWLLPDSILDDPRSLPSHAAALLARRFEPTEGDSPFAKAASFGDLVAACRALRSDGVSSRSVLAALEKSRSDVDRETRTWLAELLADEALLARDWSPVEDSDDDGLLAIEPLSLELAGTPPWSEVEGTTRLFQGAALVFADIGTIKASERDYAAYPARAGMTYERIGLVEGSYVRGIADDVGPFVAHRMLFESDLPFPFTTYTCDLHVLDRFDRRDAAGGGRLRCDVYSRSRDFHWLAGTDVWLPVDDSSGGRVGWLLLRVFGMDLAGVPDADFQREAAMRGGLGNLKRDAERRSEGKIRGADDPRDLFDLAGAR